MTNANKFQLYYKIIIDYFISSSMLDLLQLAHDSSKPKLSDNQLSKEQFFNQMMNKLKERNATNNLIIRKYIKQVCKWKSKSNQVVNDQKKELKRQITKQGSIVESIEETYRTIQKTDCNKTNIITHDEVVKNLLIQHTNHTEQTSQDQTKINSFPVIAYSSHMPNANSQTKIRFQALNPHIQIRQYFKNCNFKQKEQADKVLIQIDKQNQIQKSPLKKVNTELHPSKYQLSIKSVVFDNQSITLQKKSSKDSLKSNFFSNQMIQKYKNLKRIELSTEFHDDKIIKKGIFPIINTPSPKSQQFIENYIRMNNRVTDKSITKGKEYRNTQQNSNRNVLSFRINTIQIKKHF